MSYLFFVAQLLLFFRQLTRLLFYLYKLYMHQHFYHAYQEWHFEQKGRKEPGDQSLLPRRPWEERYRLRRQWCRAGHQRGRGTTLSDISG